MSTPSPRSPWVPEWSIADRLRKIRRDQRLSQDAFAALLDVKSTTYGAWETGRNSPDHLVALARRVELVTGVPAAWTLGVHVESPRPDGGPDGGSGLAAVRHQGLEPRTRCVTPVRLGATLRELAVA